MVGEGDPGWNLESGQNRRQRKHVCVTELRSTVEPESPVVNGGWKF
jgi:hypothetical protein